MEPSDVSRAIEAAISIATEAGLRADDAVVARNSNKLALRLLPADTFARVAHVGQGLTTFEVELAQRLATAGCPIAELEPRVEPRGYVRDGFELSLWTYYESATSRLSPGACADALARLHAGMRTIELPAPHFTERIADDAGNIGRMASLDVADRDLLTNALERLGRAVLDRSAPEQLLHGEPHVGNVLDTASGPRFIDLESCCRGPVEFDLAHLPSAVGEHDPNLDRALLRDCRGLVLAVVAKHRCDPGDQLPNGTAVLRDLLDALRVGPPWPDLATVMERHG